MFFGSFIISFCLLKNRKINEKYMCLLKQTFSKDTKLDLKLLGGDVLWLFVCCIRIGSAVDSVGVPADH